MARSVLLIIFLACILSLVDRLESKNNGQAPVLPALFILGDSTVDCGNNNWLWTVAQAKFLPYGRDFDTHQPTGRFSNGRLSIDYLADYLRLPLIPAFLSSSKMEDFFQGVNLASAGAGILNSTGSIFGQKITMRQQLQHLREVRQALVNKSGEAAASKTMSSSFYYVSVGSNDIINNYLVPGSSLIRQYNRDSFVKLLISTFRSELQELHALGARLIVVASLSPLGSVPSQLAKFANVNMNGSLFLNNMAEQFNSRLFDMLTELRQSLDSVNIIYNSLYYVLSDISRNYRQYGFKHSDTACCGMGSYNGSVPCLPNVPVCANASEFVFWDEYHPTGRTYELIAQKLWSGNINESFPKNVKTLLKL